MLAIALTTALAAATPAPASSGLALRAGSAVAQATATVRIISGTQIRFGESALESISSGIAPHFVDRMVVINGEPMPAKVADFE